ncbi:MAG: hypothetical protein EPO21_17405 [Chloroflexota bacterium]|nr:MAG: hypothetical protein EPO21_17405 [Chloroflexota bacterium]
MFGWAGTILRVDLTKGEITKQPLSREFAKNFLGGRGFNNKIIFDEFDPSITNPFDPANIICVSPGALAGTFTPSSGRLTVSVALSPRQHFMSDGNCGGHFAAETKYAGYDSIVIKGQSDSLVYLYINNDHVEIRDAKHLAGKRIEEADSLIRAELGDPDVQTLIIGPAGESRAVTSMPFAGCSRAPGNSASGGVWGAKNLKAIAVRGTKGVQVAKPAEFFKLYEGIYKRNTSDPLYQAKWSTEGSKWLLELVGSFAHNNQGDTASISRTDLSAKNFLENYGVKSRACHACHTHCGHYWRIKDGPFAGAASDSAEAGTIGPWTEFLGIDRADAGLYLSYLATDLGLDAGGTAANIAALIHMFQDGLLSEKDTGGLILEWGNVDLIIKLLEMTVQRQGIGTLIADGHEAIAEYAASGKASLEEIKRKYIRYTKKGVPIWYDARGMTGAMFSLSLKTRLIDVMSVDFAFTGAPIDREELLRLDMEPELVDELIQNKVMDLSTFKGKSVAMVFYDNLFMVSDSIGVCRRTTPWEWQHFSIHDMASFLSAATGLDFSWQDLYRSGARLAQVQNAMLSRQKIGRDYDVLPAKWLEPKYWEGFGEIVTNKAEFDKEVDQYYKLRGLNSNAVPKRAALEELGLHDVADVLGAEGFYKEEAVTAEP